MGFICKRVWWFALLILSHFLNIPSNETIWSHWFHMIITNGGGGGGGGAGGGSSPPLDPPLFMKHSVFHKKLLYFGVLREFFTDDPRGYVGLDLPSTVYPPPPPPKISGISGIPKNI